MTRERHPASQSEHLSYAENFFGIRRYSSLASSEAKNPRRKNFRKIYAKPPLRLPRVGRFPLQYYNHGLSRPEKGLQKRVNLMQQTTNSDLSRHYLPRQLRHLILQEYLSGVKTARQLSEEHGIPMSTIHKMGQRWKAKNSCSFVSTPNPFPIMSRVTRKKPVNCYPRTKPFGGTWKRLYYVWKAMRSWEISSRKIRCRPAKKSAAGQSGASKKDTQE